MATLCFNAFNRSAWFGVEPALQAQIDGAAAAGFTLFGPDVFSLAGAPDGPAADPGALADAAGAVASRLDGHGMRCYEIAALMVGDDETDAVTQARTIAALAQVLRPDWILTNVVAPVDDPLVARLSRCADIVGESGARLAVEYLPWTPVAGARAALEVATRTGLDRVKVLLDVWHHFRGPDTWDDLDAVPLDAVAYLQFSDALPMATDDLMAETIGRRVFPGEGEFDLDGWCAHVRAKGFDGVVSVEVLNDGLRDLDPAEFAKRAFTAASRYWK
ncbi:MAG TPA: TIM barrel protein [Acidimicrobiia bacterium]|nr:TIM barrel protein [Acidimicrobiia bacterium]